MPNPSHTPFIESKLIALEAVRRAHHNIDHFTTGDMTPAYRRKVLDFLAARYNRMLDESGCDGLQIPKQSEESTHGH